MQTTLIILETIFLILSILIVLAAFATSVLLLVRVARTKRGDKKDPKATLKVDDLNHEPIQHGNATQMI